MNWKLLCLGAGLLPVCFLSGQQSDAPAPQQPNPNRLVIPHLDPEAMRQAAELQKRDREDAIVINDLAGHIQSPDDAKKLVSLVASEFSKELPPRWATRGTRERIARAEYDSAAEGALIPEQHVADAWNDFLEKIGAPQESQVTAAEIHTLRDETYTSSQLFWGRGMQTIWTVPNIFAVGADSKVADGCRALEALNILWYLATQPELLQSIRDLIKKNQRFSDLIKNPSKPPAPGTVKYSVSIHMAPPNLIEMAANKYVHDHGLRAMNHAVEDLLDDLFGR